MTASTVTLGLACAAMHSLVAYGFEYGSGLAHAIGQNEQERSADRSNYQNRSVGDRDLLDFDKQAGIALFLARGALSEHGGSTLEPEHILLGIVQSAPEILRKAVPSLPGDFNDEVLRLLPKGERRSPNSEALFGERAIRVLQRARRTADRGVQVGIPHLLLGMLDDAGPAGKLLRDIDIDRDRLIGATNTTDSAPN